MTTDIGKFPKDITDRVIKDFEKNLIDDVLNLLANSYKEVQSLRVIRCIIYLAKGNIEHLTRYCESSIIDYRDVIYWAEYDSSDIKLRDFNIQFTNLD